MACHERLDPTVTLSSLAAEKVAAVHGKATMSDSNALTVNDNAVFLEAHGTGVEKEAPLKETSDSVQTKNSEQSVAADDYPHGIRLFLLAGSSIMGVFLISLDQVSTLAGTRKLLPIAPLTQGRPSLEPRSPRSRTSLVA